MTQSKQLQIYRSMREFDSKLLPTFFKRTLAKRAIDPNKYGTQLASKVLRKLKLNV